MTANRETFETVRQPGFIHVFLLMVCSCLPILGALLIAPVLPKIQAAFAGVSGVEFLVPIALTVPSLVIAILAPFAGFIVDRLGRKQLLFFGLLLYAVCGTAPLYLESLNAIIYSRVGVGLAEAAILTCCTTLIGDYFEGERRNKYLVLQTSITSISAVSFFVLGGALGEFGWRVPFWVYAISLILAPLVQIYLWEPILKRPENIAAAEISGLPFRPAMLAVICLITLLMAICFYIVPIHLPFLLDERGTKSPQIIGLLAGVSQAAVVLGTFVFHRLSHQNLNVPRLLALGFAACGSGLLILVFSTGLIGVAVGISINGLGCGILLPTMLTWNMSLLPANRRGFGIGAWTASFFLGNFLNPLIILSLAKQFGGRAPTINFFGWIFFAAAVVFLAISFWKQFQTTIIKRESEVLH